MHPYSSVVFVFACPATRSCTSICPPYVKWSVMPVAPRVWQLIAISIPTAAVRRRTMYQT
jgi:hypothetical protein